MRQKQRQITLATSNGFMARPIIKIHKFIEQRLSRLIAMSTALDLDNFQMLTSSGGLATLGRENKKSQLSTYDEINTLDFMLTKQDRSQLLGESDNLGYNISRNNIQIKKYGSQTPIKFQKPISIFQTNQLTPSQNNLPSINRDRDQNISSQQDQIINKNQNQMPPRFIMEIKRQFKEFQLDVKTLFALKWEFSRRDIYTFSFSNDKELKFFIENLNIHLPEAFISLIFECVVHPKTGKINFVLFKQFIDICQDTVFRDNENKVHEIKKILFGDQIKIKDESDFSTIIDKETDILQQCGKEIETKLNERYVTIRNAFRAFDVNKNGLISESEFIEGLVQLNANLNENQIRQVFAELDKEKRGQISFENFCGLVQKRPLKLDYLKKLEGGILDLDDTKSIIQQMSMSGSTRSRSEMRNGLNSRQAGIAVKNQSRQTDKPLENLSRNQAPQLQLSEKVFGKKTQRSEDIGKVINFDYLNQALKQRLRDQFKSFNENSTSQQQPWLLEMVVLVRPLLSNGMNSITKFLLASYIHDQFPEEHVPTVLDCYRTEVHIDNKPLTLQIWDSAGQDDYSRLRPLGYADADVFLLCYSVADRDSYKNVDQKWIPELRNSAPSVPIILVGTKLDMRNESNTSTIVSTSEGVATQNKHSFFAHVECSAKNLNNYKTSFDKAIIAVMKHRDKSSQKIKKKKRLCEIF
ncbi:ras-related c3 botulinum toxin substrate 2 [Stylonychia lemnae]|uniref:Ras-related c3 botulinum toxin substrate 2 n=1 Tax=Stylonychia lemnae TaxID=5949 RepID=A0A078A9W7_STYLE|nr:ras-related c3 botulinum toxin substrate 2 [Stylonychia lemnae]|eukprot:CDW77593.1 ras-related c3 botulinum toxin substrate 2 [Stylonychia lemnae]